MTGAVHFRKRQRATMTDKPDLLADYELETKFAAHYDITTRTTARYRKDGLPYMRSPSTKPRLRPRRSGGSGKRRASTLRSLSSPLACPATNGLAELTSVSPCQRRREWREQAAAQDA